jgi:hypothetical protein
MLEDEDEDYTKQSQCKTHIINAVNHSTIKIPSFSLSTSMIREIIFCFLCKI